MNKPMKHIPYWKSNRTRPEPKEMIATLYSAKKKLNRMKANYFNGICECLPNTKAGDYLCDYICYQLGSYGYLSGWLCDKFDRSQYEFNTHQRFKEARLMWIDWMIASLKGKEYIP